MTDQKHNPTPGNYEVEPPASTREGARAIRQMFVALRNEGFTEQQALTIVGQMLSATLTQGQSDE